MRQTQITFEWIEISTEVNIHFLEDPKAHNIYSNQRFKSILNAKNFKKLSKKF